MTQFPQRFSFDPGAQQILVHTGKIEIGQHVHRAFEKIVAQTLAINSSRVRVSQVTTESSPDDGMTVGSLSMQLTGAAIRNAAMTLRDTLFTEASQQLNVDVDDITLDPDTLEFSTRGSKSCSVFDTPAAMSAVIRASNPTATPVPAASHTAASITAASIKGSRQYIQDLVLPDMIHARALRGRTFTPVSTDSIRIINDGGFSALVAETEVALDLAWARVEKEPVARPTTCDGPVTDWIQQQRVHTQTSGDTYPINGTINQSSTRPFLLHASIAPSCAIALYKHSKLTIWTHSQGIFPLRDTIARHLGMPTDDVIVRHVPSAGCYGHNAADDAAMDAVLVSLQNEGLPVRILWTRQDDFQYSPVGAAMQVQVEAQLSENGSIRNWRQTIWSCPHAQRPGSSGHINLCGAIEQDSKHKSKDVTDLPDTIGSGAARNATPPYSIESFGVTTHIAQDLPVRTSSIRGLGAQMNVVSIEAAMDKLASSCGTDPLDFRLQHLKDPRGCEVLHQLKMTINKASVGLQENEAIGVGYSRYKGKAAYGAVAARVRLTDKVALMEVWAVVDAGHIVDRSAAVNQIEGGIIQATSWTLCEGALLRGGYIDAVGWEDYPILGWSDIPEIHTALLGEHSDLPYLGVGECMVGPVSAAIVNGVSKVAGCSMSDLPLTYEKFIQAATQ